MTQRESILVCILPDLNADVFHRFVTNAALFAQRIDADAHFLTPAGTQGALNSVMKELQTHEKLSIKTVFHPTGDNCSFATVCEALHLYSCDLIAVPAGAISEDSGQCSQDRKDLLEGASVPLLMLSPEVDLAKTPVGSVLIPMSGELRNSSALIFGLRLASQIHIPVDLLHVAKGEFKETSLLETTGDQFQHEYRERLDRVLAEGSPFSGVKERALVRTLYDVRGTPSEEILKVSNKNPSCAVVAEWHGSLIHGKAETLKNLLHRLARPLFLVKAESEQKSTLRIGPESRVA